MHFDGKMKSNRRKIERGLGILPYGNLWVVPVALNFSPCVMTWAVLAMLVSVTVFLGLFKKVKLVDICVN